MKKIIAKSIAITLAFCVAFSGLPFLAGNLEAHALAKKKLPKNITLQAAASGQTEAKLAWNKIKSPSKGYAVFRDGEAIAHLNTKKTAFTDQGLASGTAHTYQIKTYTKKTVKMWFNKKTEKWQKKKPAKKYRGKSRKEAVYTYKKKSNTVRIQTEGPKNNTPSDTSKNNTPSDTSQNNTPADTQKNNTPSDTQKNNTPSDTQKNNTSADTQKDNTPADTSQNNTQEDASKADTSITITWKNWDGSTLKTDSVEKGKTPSYSGSTPTRAADSNYTYTFSGWNPSIVAATANATYTAQYTATAKPTYYTITWKNWDGSTLKTTSVEKGKTPSYGGTPTRPADSNYTYTFSGWSPSIVPATANATYTAQYTAKSKYTYDIKFLNEPYGNGGETVIYLITDNPNPYGYVLGILNSNGQEKNLNLEHGYDSSSSSTIYGDLDTSVLGNNYIAICSPECTGNCSIVVYEYDDYGYKIMVASKSVYIKDYQAEGAAWRQRVIQNVCSSSMTNKEKMQEICGYILLNFRYPPNYRGQYVLMLKDVGIPYWVIKELDSAGSPAVLLLFGNDLGYPLESLATKYERGTPEWQQWHMYVYSAADDTYFKACPATDTGTINPSNITMFNPNTYQFWED